MINIIAVDKSKDDNINKLINNYLLRLNNRLKITTVDILPEKYKLYDCIEKALDREAHKILDCINKKDLIITLDEKGKHYSSIDFTKLIYTTINHKHITFIIGGAYGLSSIITDKSDLKLSLSNLTFTHEIAKLLLIEQIYRAYCINSNIKYHHE
jgi:23S rRNA (pseudouridine1915-N3)-methyltransferase